MRTILQYFKKRQDDCYSIIEIEISFQTYSVDHDERNWSAFYQIDEIIERTEGDEVPYRYDYKEQMDELRVRVSREKKGEVKFTNE